MMNKKNKRFMVILEAHPNMENDFITKILTEWYEKQVENELFIEKHQLSK